MNICISKNPYQELINHLEINAEADSSAQILLEKLKAEAQPNYRLESGAYLLDGNPQKPKYSV